MEFFNTYLPTIDLVSTLIPALHSRNLNWRNLGELEKTKFLRFCRGQNLRHLFSELLLPNEVHPVIKFFEKRFHTNIRGTIFDTSGLTDKVKLLPFPQKPLRKSLLLEACDADAFRKWLSLHRTDAARFKPLDAIVLRHTSRFNRRFEAGATPNSRVLFRFNLTNGPPTHMAGQIGKLFAYDNSIFAIVQPFKTLSQTEQEYDYLRHLPPAAGFLIRAELDQNILAVPFTSILSHIATNLVFLPGFPSQYLHVILLN